MCVKAVEAACAELGFDVLGWRDVPTDSAAADLGESALATEPDVAQLFVAPRDGDQSAIPLETRLYVLRRLATVRTKQARGAPADDVLDDFYVCSLSSRTVVYKGQPARPGHALLSRPSGRVVHRVPIPGAQPLLHEHVPELGPRAAAAHDGANGRSTP